MRHAIVALALFAAAPAAASTITPISIPIDPNAGTITGLNWTYNGTLASPIVWASNTPVWQGLPLNTNWLRFDFQFITPFEPLTPDAVGIFAMVRLVLAGPFPFFEGSLSGPLLAGGLLAINNPAGVLPDIYSQYTNWLFDYGYMRPAGDIDLVSASFGYLFGNPPVVITGYQLQVFTMPYQAPSVPEPDTWALMLFGFAFFAIKGIWPAWNRK